MTNMIPERVDNTVGGMMERASLDRPHQPEDEEVLLTFGAISDVQCGDLDDRMTPGLSNRYYRDALSKLAEAVKDWKQRHPAPSFILQLGDVLDGANAKQGGKYQSRRILRSVLQEFSDFPGPVHHVLGNHEFYNFTRLELLNSPLFSGARFLKRCHPEAYKSGIASLKSRHCKSSNHTFPALAGSIKDWNMDNRKYGFTDESIPAYYDFSPVQGFRFVLLDTFDISELGYVNDDSLGKVTASKIWEKHTEDNITIGSKELVGKEQRFVSYNGGIGQEQLKWLKCVLNRAKQNREKVVVFGHVPICPDVTLDDCLVWNYKDALTLLQSSQCVVATLFGHTHRYRYHTDEAGIHHLVLPGVVECEPGTNGFITFDMFAESMLVHKAGELSPLRLKYNHT